MTTLELTQEDKDYYSEAFKIASENSLVWEFQVTLLNDLMVGTDFKTACYDALYEWDLA